MYKLINKKILAGKAMRVMKGKNEDHAGVIAPPPVLYIGGFGLALLMQQWIPLNYGRGLYTLAAGALMIGTAIVFAGWASRLMRRSGTHINPSKPTTVIVSEGPYRVSRNPLYVSLTLFYIGISLWVSTLWTFILLPLIIIVMQYGVIEREERYLEAKFGGEYVEYKERVRRWI